MPKKYEIGLSVSRTIGIALDEASFYDMKAGGIDVVEISEGKIQGYEGYVPAEIKQAADAAGVRLWSLHLPFTPFSQIDLSSPDKAKRDFNHKILSEMIAAWSAVGIERFVVHPSIEPIEDDARGERLKYAAESLAALAEIAAAHGGTIAVEDLPRTCCGRDSAEILYLLSAHDKLRACLDTNHLLKEDLTDFILAVGERIITTHISDYDFINERHWMPGEGDLCWPKVLEALDKIGYTGPWLYEVAPKALPTIHRRDLTFRDYYANAMALFQGEKPIQIGQRKENLGFLE